MFKIVVLILFFINKYLFKKEVKAKLKVEEDIEKRYSLEKFEEMIKEVQYIKNQLRKS
jgi:hypothetical protein